MTLARQLTPAPDRAEGSRDPDDRWRAVPEELLPVLNQLLSGVTDTVACHRLNMSPRTFSRRVADLLELLGVQTRFQLGFELARQSRQRAAEQQSRQRLVER